VEKVEFPSSREGYAYLSVADTSSLTLASLKEALAKAPFRLHDVMWTVRVAEKKVGSP
jgi:hypothetical protein